MNLPFPSGISTLYDIPLLASGRVGVECGRQHSSRRLDDVFTFQETGQNVHITNQWPRTGMLALLHLILRFFQGVVCSVIARFVGFLQLPLTKPWSTTSL